MKLIRWLCIAVITALLASCTPGAPVSETQTKASTQPANITLDVFAAASLTQAFTELGNQFQAQHPGVKVALNFGGSDQLAQGINQGAPTDVFASANEQQMKVAEQSGRIVTKDVVTFLHNRLVVIVAKQSQGKVASLADLTKPGLLLVLAAKEVPVGQYALNFLDKASQDPVYGPDFKAKVLKNVVSYEQNVTGVLSKVTLGEVDAGIVYSSDVSGDYGSKVIEIPIPDNLNVIASYPIVSLKDSQHPALASAFVDLVLSPAGQKVLAQYGFIPVSN